MGAYSDQISSYSTYTLLMQKFDEIEAANEAKWATIKQDVFKNALNFC